MLGAPAVLREAVFEIKAGTVRDLYDLKEISRAERARGRANKTTTIRGKRHPGCPNGWRGASLNRLPTSLI